MKQTKTHEHLTQKLKVGILGATGMVGQNYIRLLENHPWFEVSYVAASPQSAGKTYAEAVKGRWHFDCDISPTIAKLVVQDAARLPSKNDCDFVFSALDSAPAKELEEKYAAAGFPVVSNASTHRHTPDVPMLIPEINADHISAVDHQRKSRGWTTGFIAVKPNCSLQSYLAPMYALHQKYKIKRAIIATMQAVSGAGHPGVSSFDIIDNIIPYIAGEEEKSEKEPRKILGHFDSAKGVFVYDESFTIAAHCNRVPVIDGHTACVSVEFETKPTQDQILQAWKEFSGEPQKLHLPFAPSQAIIYREEANRPQPRKDRDTDKGMAVTVGRLRECPVFHYRFVGLSHNTVRGAAGGGILNAELLYAKGYIKKL